jgi:hypothetical protein
MFHHLQPINPKKVTIAGKNIEIGGRKTQNNQYMTNCNENLILGPKKCSSPLPQTSQSLHVNK